MLLNLSHCSGFRSTHLGKSSIDHDPTKYYQYQKFYNLTQLFSEILFRGLGTGDWGLGIGDWGLGIGRKEQGKQGKKY
ncbi:hypothetical protein CV014_02690 [Nostoc sp. CMAA1605]|nr:hypothetical protein [Nostoc sp. CMAA1605]